MEADSLFFWTPGLHDKNVAVTGAASKDEPTGRRIAYQKSSRRTTITVFRDQTDMCVDKGEVE